VWPKLAGRSSSSAVLLKAQAIGGHNDNLAAIEDTTLKDWSRTLGVDQTGVFLRMKTAAALAASGHGSVINISSIFGTSGGLGTLPAYHAAKARSAR